MHRTFSSQKLLSDKSKNQNEDCRATPYVFTQHPPTHHTHTHAHTHTHTHTHAVFQEPECTQGHICDMLEQCLRRYRTMDTE
jgi:hypothetical protein